MGFKSLHGNGDHDIVTNANYVKVGFGSLVDTRLAPLMFLGVWGSPSLGLGSTNNLVISLGLWMVVVLALCCEGGNALGDEGKLRFVSWICFMSVSWLLICYNSHPHRLWLCLQVTG